MHKGVILLVKATDREEALAEAFKIQQSLRN